MLAAEVQLARGDFLLDARFTTPTPGVTALFGRSGCGKTTLVNVLAGLLPARGRIALDEEVWLDSSVGVNVPADKRRIGYVFQDARLFPHYSVRGNLLYGAPRSAPRREFDDVVALLGLAPLLARRPGSLSGGERQRVALGRALLSRPRLLLLDEPLASLDVSRREEVLPYLERLRDTFAIPMVFVSHQFDEVLRLATHLAVLDQGRVVASGGIGAVSLAPALRDIVGIDAVGAVVEGRVERVDPAQGLSTVRIGTQNRLYVTSTSLAPGQRVRLQLLARDLILAVEEPRGLSVRNQLRGHVVSVTEDQGATLVEVDIGGATLLARISAAATRELGIRPGLGLWALVKAVSFSAHAMGVGIAEQAPAAGSAAAT
ncbi:MAG: molybdenum ABC transporter ATP-binding protein [Pseudomonadota bacterium]|jgi:molybdate transport system ATP-binding protein|nr:MAG: molybdenum ABC transporter ATP-binding protein [Pseudomonadota bacterium]